MTRHMVLVSGLLLLSPMVFSGSAALPAHSIPKDFTAMQQLLGTWHGRTEMEGKAVQMTVTYELTSAGTAITERLMQGTPEEMVSVYHKDGDGVAMTHYCALGNQPHMKLKSSDGKVMVFEMDEPVGIQSEDEPHMHAVTLTLKTDNILEQRWTHYVDGKQADIVTFELQRQ